jgi:hypothetical protein
MDGLVGGGAFRVGGLDLVKVFGHQLGNGRE